MTQSPGPETFGLGFLFGALAAIIALSAIVIDVTTHAYKRGATDVLSGNVKYVRKITATSDTSWVPIEVPCRKKER